MIINHNVATLNTYRNAQQNSQAVNKATSKLSSGMKINQAADDSAGLAISEKMRGQIRGLEQAKQNVQNGISLVQVAEAGLGEIANPNLVRLRELAIQAANDTLTEEDRKTIQEEINQTIEGIDDIAMHTNFNTIPLLNGATQLASNIGGASPGYNYENVLDRNAVDSQGTFTFKTNQGYPTTSMDKNQRLVYDLSVTSFPAVRIGNASYILKDASSITPTQEIDEKLQTVFEFTDVEVTQLVSIVKDKYQIEYQIKNTGTTPASLGFQFHLDVMLGNDDNAPFIVDGVEISEQKIYEGNAIPEEFTVFNQNTGANTNAEFQAGGIIKGDDIDPVPDKFAIGQYSAVSNWNFDTNGGDVGDSGYSLWWNPREIAAGEALTVKTFYGQSIPPTIDNPEDTVNLEPRDLVIQAGSNEGQNIKIQLSDVRTRKLGISHLNVMSHEAANQAIGLIDQAAAVVSSERTKFGVYQNAMEHIEANIGNYQENLTASESRIRDADIAKEITALTGHQILLQSSQAMLSQANQITQGILQLLK